MSVDLKTEYVVSRQFSESKTLEELLLRIAKQRIEADNDLRQINVYGIISNAKHPIIMPTETEAQ